MTVEKSPISILQELAQIRRIPAPIFDVEQIGKTFRVTLKLGPSGKIFSEGVNINKKLAKQLCATNALKLLKINVNSTLTSSAKNKFMNINSSDYYHNLDRNSMSFRKSCESLSSNVPFNNYVGKLNEICSKNLVAYPTYRECGISNGEFITECKIFDNTITIGRAKTKKDSKQKAAEEMFKLLNNSSESRFQKLMESTNAVEKLEKISLNIEDEVDIQGSQRKTLVKFDALPVTKQSDISSVAHMNKEQLKRELEKLNIIYKISNIETADKITMVLKTKPTSTCRSHTFLASGHDSEKVGMDLLRKAVFGLRILKD